MTDDQVERLIWRQIKRRDITVYDMIGLPNHGVDPTPEDKITPPCEKGIRSNRFQSSMGSDRIRELLCVGEYNRGDDYSPLKVSFQDLFHFWWNRCVQREYVVDEVLDDIYDYFTEQMRSPEKEKKSMDLTVDFWQLPLFTMDLEQAA